MDQTKKLLIRNAVRGIEEAEGGTARDYAGLRRDTERALELLIGALFPLHGPERPAGLSLRQTREEAIGEAVALLERSLRRVLPASPRPEEVVLALLSALPAVRVWLETDLQAAYEGDPAAKSVDEVILCYPAFTAIAAYRIAHVLYGEGVPLLPRIMSEYAHRLTGIDIHPGAAIGPYFFIDHGTGVVIGETTTIGAHVKLYQHVTLGARSFAAAEDGSLVKGLKRHPDIGDNVVIYSGATVLGGETKIGDGCVIGGSVWLTHSVAPGKTVLARAAVTQDNLLRDRLPEPIPDDPGQNSLLNAML